jgi:hypothetical protein
MNSPIGWVLPAVAIGATVLAVWAGSNLAVAIPAAALAVLAAGLLFAGAWLDERRQAPRRSPLRAPPENYRLRSALRSGRLGREELVTALDRVERTGPHPDLPSRTARELEALAHLSPRDFQDYLRTRLDDLEARV